jgi:2-aminomuconate deaminase
LLRAGQTPQIAGRSMPGSVFRTNLAIAIKAPVLPADTAAAAPRFRRAGPFVFIAGTAAGEGGDIRAQTAATIEELRAVLAAAGGGLENMVEVTTYLVTMADFARYNDAYSAYFSADGPARTTVAVERLSRPGQLIEIRGTAYIARGAADA